MRRRRRSLAEWDAALCDELDLSWRQAQRRAGGYLVCEERCTECCIGPFPITALDAWRLRRGMQLLDQHDPARAAAVRARAAQAWQALAASFPGDAKRGALVDDEAARDPFFEAHSAMPCPALDPVSLRCDLYAHRPVSCRTFGPPTACGDQALPPCRLCFVGASAAEVERARVEPDPGDLEARALLELPEAEREVETVVAAVLARGEPDSAGSV